MSRILCLLLAAVFLGALALVAQENGAIRTNVTAVTTPPVAVASPHPSSKIWSALVLATNSSDPKSVPPQLKEFAPQMKKIFGYNQYQLISNTNKEIVERTPAKLELGKGIWMNLISRRALSKEAKGGCLLNVQLYHEDRSLLESELKLAPASPLFIRGPQYGNGQLIIVLQVDR
jgi:hypothetical protein